MGLNDHYRALGRAWDALAKSDDCNRVACIIDVAELLEDLADSGLNRPDSDRAAAVMLRQIAHADLLATGMLTRRDFDTSIEPAARLVLDRIAGEPDLEARAELLPELAVAIQNPEVAETVACMPYGPGDWCPSSRTFRGFLGALKWSWRQRRAA